MATEAIESPKVSGSEADRDEIDLMRLDLSRRNLLPPAATDTEVRELYHRSRNERAEEAQRAKASRDAEFRRSAAAAEEERLRAALRRAGIGYDGLTVEQMQAALVAHNEEWRKQQQAAAEEDRQRRREAMGRKLFEAARCTPKAIAGLELAEAGACKEWKATRDLLIDQAGYADGFMVVLLGFSGVGKTVLATSVIKACCANLMTCRYVTANDLFEELWSGYRQMPRGEAGIDRRDLLNAWRSPDLLVIDDLHQRTVSEAQQNALIPLLDNRYAYQRCTILIANQDKEKFSAGVGDSVVSRMFETGDALECNWPSFRDAARGRWKRQVGDERRVPSGIAMLGRPNGG